MLLYSESLCFYCVSQPWRYIRKEAQIQIYKVEKPFCRIGETFCLSYSNFRKISNLCLLFIYILGNHSLCYVHDVCINVICRGTRESSISWPFDPVERGLR